MSSITSSPDSRLIRRDPRVWASVLVLVVSWGLALLNMAGFSVKRGSTSADSSDWKVTFGIAVVASVILVPLVVARVLMWKSWFRRKPLFKQRNRSPAACILRTRTSLRDHLTRESFRWCRILHCFAPNPASKSRCMSTRKNHASRSCHFDASRAARKATRRCRRVAPSLTLALRLLEKRQRPLR